MFYVCIEHLSDRELTFFGFVLVEENEDFKMYRQWDGSQHIVEKHGRPFLKVEDVNDALAMQATNIVHFKP